MSIKKFIAGLGLVTITALLIVICLPVSQAEALDDHPVPTDGAFYDGTVNSDARTALSNNLAGVIVDAAAADLVLMTAQNDTNVTMDATLFTPRYLGDHLIGTVSNVILHATGATTNDWN